MNIFPRSAWSTALLAILTVATGSCSDVAIERCVERAMKLGGAKDGAKQGFELIDLSSREVWLTRDWDPEEFSNFSLPPDWIMWRKNDPRTSAVDSGSFRHSPDCASGEFTYMTALGREFLHVVNLQNFGEVSAETQGLIRAVTLTKHHETQWEAGTVLRVLTDPDGQRYLLIARTWPVPQQDPTLPDGWTLERITLEAPFTFALDGEVQVLRMDNEDSFQGPLPKDLEIPVGG
ncbi:MAG: hypothetical protein AAF249_09280 [Pseudomonadota bacterium]